MDALEIKVNKKFVKRPQNVAIIERNKAIKEEFTRLSAVYKTDVIAKKLAEETGLSPATIIALIYK